MAIVSTLLLTLVLAADEPLSVDELNSCVSAVEQNHSRLRSMRVRYRLEQERQPGGQEDRIPVSDEEFTIDWEFQQSKQHYLQTSASSRFEWWTDGRTTSEWYSKRGEPDKLERVGIDHSPPRPSLRWNNLAGAIGYCSPGIEEGLISLVKQAVERKTLSGRRRVGSWKVVLGSQEINRGNCEVMLELDRDHDLRISSWTLLELLPADASNEKAKSYKHSYKIDEFQQVTDEATGGTVWFPLRAHLDQPLLLTKIEVDSVQFNVPIDDSAFVPPVIPVGTPVMEEMGPGKMQKHYLMGGLDAEQQRSKDLAKLGDKERTRLDRKGTRFNATPVTSSSSWLWLLLGIFCFLLILPIRIRRKRR